MLNTVGALVLPVLLPALACFLLPQQVYDPPTWPSKRCVGVVLTDESDRRPQCHLWAVERNAERRAQVRVDERARRGVGLLESAWATRNA